MPSFGPVMRMRLLKEEREGDLNAPENAPVELLIEQRISQVHCYHRVLGCMGAMVSGATKAGPSPYEAIFR